MLAHLDDVKGIQEPLKFVDMSSLKLHAVAPANEIEKLRSEIEWRGYNPIMWTLDNEAFWM